MSSRKDLAPDSHQLILGWRVWGLEMTGALTAIAAGSGPWAAGVNEARCHLLDTRHRAPGRGCVCGFNALHRPPLEYMHDRGYALGAIGAWGDVDIYRTGFRSQFACVLSLVEDGDQGSIHEAKLAKAADRYEVPVLDLEDLHRYALGYAAPVTQALLPADRRRRRAGSKAPIGPARVPTPLPTRALPEEFVGRGVAVNSHLAVDHQRQFMRLGPTPSLAAMAGDRIEPAVAPDAWVEQGQSLFTATVGEGACQVPVPSPVAGKVIKLNDGLPLPDYASGPAANGWLVDLRLESNSLDHSGISWGRQGAEAYRKTIRAAGSDADLLMRSSPSPIPASELVGADESRGWLRAFAQALDTEIRANEALCGALRTLARSVIFDVRGVEALSVAAPPLGDGRWVRTASPSAQAVPPPGALRIELGPEELREWWRGERGLDPDDVSSGEPGAPRDMRAPLHLTAGTRGDLLLVNSLHSRAFGPATAILDDLGNPWFKAGDAVRNPIRSLEVLAGFKPPDGLAGAAPAA